MSTIIHNQPSGDSPGTPDPGCPPPVNIAAALRRRIVSEAVIEAERGRGYAEGFAAAREAYMAQAVRLANCPQCWARPGRPCTVTGPPGDHLARYQRAERRGLIGREDLAAVVAGLEVIAAHVIITGGAL